MVLRSLCKKSANNLECVQQYKTGTHNVPTVWHTRQTCGHSEFPHWPKHKFIFISFIIESIKVGRLTQSQTPCDLHPSLQWTFFTWLCGRSWAVNVKVRACVSEHENLVACGCVYACIQWTKSHVCMLNQSVTRIPLWWFTRSWRFEQRKRETRECVHRRGLTVGALLWI